MNSSVRLGIVGGGRAAEKLYVPTLPKTMGGQVVAVMDTREDRRELIAGAFEGCRSFASVSQMLEQAKLDAVVIATPPASHLSVARQALAAGCHVLVEKPLAEDLREARELIAQVPDARDRLMVGFNRRWWLPIRRMKEAVARHRGQAIKIDAAFCIDVSGWDPLTGAVDPLDDLGSHYLDLVRFVLGDEIVSLTAVRPNARRIEIDLRTKGGATARLEHEHGPSTYEYFDVAAGSKRYRMAMGSDRIQPAEGPGRKLGDLTDKVLRKIQGKGWTLGDSYIQQFNSFFSAVAKKSAHTPNYEDGMQCMLAVEAARQSAAQGGQEVKLDEL